MEKIDINFSVLRKVYSDVIFFTKKNASWYKNPTSKTRIEEDLGLYGMDNEQFLIDFSEKFNVNFENLNYSEYLTSEWEVANPKYLIYLPIVIPYNLTKLILRIIVWPLNKKISDKIKNHRLPIGVLKPKKDITIGDLVSSVLESEFTGRKSMYFKIKTA